MTTSSGEHLKDISHAHIVSLRYKLKTSAKDSDDLSIGIDRDRAGMQDELAPNKNTKDKNNKRSVLKDVFGFAEIQEEATYGLG